jgi:hypothetical protein
MNARACLAAVLIIACAGCAAKAAAPQATPEPTLISSRGKSFSLDEARRKVAFRPFLPARGYVDVAMLPAFFGGDDPKNWGIGLEYAVNGKRFALSEWPERGQSLTAYTIAKKEGECTDVHTFLTQHAQRANGYIWSTPRGLVMTLQPDFNADRRAMAAEFRRLVRRGICR